MAKFRWFRYVPEASLPKRLLCAITGHRPQIDVHVGYTTHYPHPCWCGEWLGEHVPCDCAIRWPQYAA